MKTTTKRAQRPAQPPTAAEYDYLLRGINLAVWEQFKTNAEAQGLTSREALLELVGAYAGGAISLRRSTTLQINDPALRRVK